MYLRYLTTGSAAAEALLPPVVATTCPFARSRQSLMAISKPIRSSSIRVAASAWRQIAANMQFHSGAAVFH
jgi:hypothetical protein